MDLFEGHGIPCAGVGHLLHLDIYKRVGFVKASLNREKVIVLQSLRCKLKNRTSLFMNIADMPEQLIRALALFYS
jgi:hypothetical protein